IGREIPEAIRHALLQLRLKGMIPARHRLRVDAQIAEPRVRAARLHAARAGRRDVDVLRLLLTGASGPYVVDLQHRQSEKLLLKADAPALIASRLRFERQRAPSDRAD